MCVAYSGGGTRYARLPPVIEVIPRRGITPYGLMSSHHYVAGIMKLTRSATPVGYLTDIGEDMVVDFVDLFLFCNFVWLIALYYIDEIYSED